MLTESDIRALKQLMNSTTGRLMEHANAVLIDGQGYPKTLPRRLVSMTAIREIETVGSITYYEITANGRLIANNPEMAEQILSGLAASGSL